MRRENAWQTEPDYLKFRDAGTGLLCVIKRHPAMLHLCGYVRLPRGAKLHRESVTIFDRKEVFWRLAGASKLRVHGGITFTAKSGLLRPKGGTLRGSWIAFDCAHHNDMCPGYTKFGIEPAGVYRTIGFVRSELEHLCRQIARLHMK